MEGGGGSGGSAQLHVGRAGEVGLAEEASARGILGGWAVGCGFRAQSSGLVFRGHGSVGGFVWGRGRTGDSGKSGHGIQVSSWLSELIEEREQAWVGSAGE